MSSNFSSGQDSQKQRQIGSKLVIYLTLTNSQKIMTKEQKLQAAIFFGGSANGRLQFARCRLSEATATCNGTTLRLQLQTKDKEGDITIEYYYNDGDLEDRAWNQKTVRFVRELEENCTLVEMMKNQKDKKLEDDNTGGQDVKGVSVM